MVDSYWYHNEAIEGIVRDEIRGHWRTVDEISASTKLSRTTVEKYLDKIHPIKKLVGKRVWNKRIHRHVYTREYQYITL
jgi:predicted transcriptional regulator